MINVAAIRMQQFGVQFYQASLTASDIDKLVRFEVLSYGDSAQTPSIELHRALGFRHIGAVENVGFKFGRWLDTVLMQRPLGPGATKPPTL